MTEERPTYEQQAEDDIESLSYDDPEKHRELDVGQEDPTLANLAEKADMPLQPIGQYERRPTQSLTTTSPDPAQMLQAAMERDLSVEKLERFMALYEKWQADQARRAYYRAMAAFHAECPDIEKNKHVEYPTRDSSGDVSYWHATLGHIVGQVNPVLGRHGLAFSWQTEQEGIITVHCDVFHQDGHTVRTTLTGAPDASGKKNDIQKVGSTITYLQRYTLMAALGLATMDQDDDGIAAGQPAEDVVSEEQAAELKKLIEETGADTLKFLEAAGGYACVDDLPARKFNGAKLRLMERREKLNARSGS